MTENEKYQLFLDLDGVLADFEKGVESLLGKPPAELLPRQMWPRLARASHFYDTLEWMEDGKALWQFCQPFQPVILTGLPMGKWAEPQKRIWCARELGSEIEVITCMSRQKPAFAFQRANGKIPVLVDDRIKLQAPFEETGGIFVHHQNSEDSIAALKQLGY